MIALEKEVAQAIESLRKIGLYNNSIELGKAEKSFHDVFTKQFCVEINSRVAEGIRDLRQLNNELKNLKFGSDSFSIDWSKWEPEFEDYLSFFEAVNHSKGYSDGNGTSNNLAESFNWRMRRAAEGIYLNPSNKYLTEYATEQAWREDTRKLSTGKKLRHLFRHALSVGMSLWFRGYTHGKHREYEVLLEGDRPAKGRGRPKGWKAKPPR